MNRNDIWSAEKEQALRDCIAAKMSAGKTAEIMHITPGAANGKAHRMGLKFLSIPGSPSKRKKRQPTAAVVLKYRTRAENVPLPAAPEPYGGFLGIRLIDLPTNTCHFIEGETSNALYCGQPADGPWCAHHRQLCYHRPVEAQRISKEALYRL